LNSLQSLKANILRLFGTKLPPSIPKGWSKNNESFEDMCVFWGKEWDNLSVDDFHNNMYVFNSVPKESFPYFLGAHMYASLVEGVFFSDALAYICDNPLVAPYAHGKPSIVSLFVMSSLSPQQLSVFVSFLEYIAQRLPDYERSIVENTRKVLIEEK